MTAATTANKNSAALNAAANAAKKACGLSPKIKKELIDSSTDLAKGAKEWATKCTDANTKNVATKLADSATKFATTLETVKPGNAQINARVAQANAVNKAKAPPAPPPATTQNFLNLLNADKAAKAPPAPTPATTQNFLNLLNADKAPPPAPPAPTPATTQNFLNLLNAGKTSAGNPNIKNGYQNFGTPTHGGGRRNRNTKSRKNKTRKNKRNTRKGNRR
jgi:hypothetical protein